jgi:hypothetical protein
MSLSIAGLIALEVVERLCAAVREWTGVTVVRIVAVVDVTVPAAGAVEPGSGAQKDSAIEPIGAVIAIRGAIIWCIVEIAVGANGLDSDADDDLC